MPDIAWPVMRMTVDHPGSTAAPRFWSSGQFGTCSAIVCLAPIWLFMCALSSSLTTTTVDQEGRGNAERRALFVGLWPPMFWLIGDSLQEAE